MVVIIYLINLRQLNLNNESTLNIKQLSQLPFYKHAPNLPHDRLNCQHNFNSLRLIKPKQFWVVQLYYFIRSTISLPPL